MPNLKSSKKRVKQNEKRHQINLARKTSVKTAVRKVLDSLKRGDPIIETKKLLRDAESKIARARVKGVAHRKTASRKVSRLVQRIVQTERTGK